MLAKLEENKIQYTKANGDISTRTIIPIWVPKPHLANVKSIDVTSLSVSQRNTVKKIAEDYVMYVDGRMNDTLSFDDFLSVMGNDKDAPSSLFKWRTFKPDKIELIE